MTRLRIYSGGTGNIQYDSSGAPQEEESAQARREFNDGVLLYYDPAAETVHGYVKLHRGAEEQFLAIYEDGAGDPVAGFKRAVEEAADERDWRVVSASQVNQEVFETLGTSRTTEPNIDLAQIREELQRHGSIGFTAGDGRSAVELFEYLRETLPELTIAITTTGRPDSVSDAPVVIEVDESHTHGQPTVTAEVAKRLHERQVDADREQLTERLDALARSIRTSTRAQLGRRMASRLEAAGVPSRFGLVIRGAETPSTEREILQRYAIVSFTLVALAGLLVAIQSAASGLSEPLGRQVWLGLPFVEIGTTVPSTFVLGGYGLVVLVMVLSARTVRRTFGVVLVPVKLLLGAVLPSGRSRRGSGGQQAQAVVQALSQLESRVTSEERFVREASDALSRYGVEVTTEETATQRRRLVSIAGPVVGIVAGALLTAGIYLSLDRVVDVVSTNWLAFLQAVVVLAAVAVVVRIGGLVWGLLRPTRSTGPSYASRSRRSGSSGGNRTASSASRSSRGGKQRRTGARSSGSQRGTGGTATSDRHARQSSASGSSGRSSGGQSRGSNDGDTRPSSSSEATSSSSGASSGSEGGTSESTEAIEDVLGGSDGSTVDTDPDDGGSTVDIDTGDVSDDEGDTPVDADDDTSVDTGSDTSVDVGTESRSDSAAGSSERSTGGSPSGSAPSLSYLGPSTGPPGDEHPMYRYDAANTGHAAGVTDAVVAKPGESRWASSMGADVRSSPAVAHGTVYAGSQEGSIRAFDTDSGDVIATFETGAQLAASPAVTDDHLFVCCRDGTIHVLGWRDLDHVTDTNLGADILASPTTVDWGVIVATMDGQVVALDTEQGNRRWEYEADGFVATTPATDGDLTYVGTGSDDDSGAVVAITDDGEKAWGRHLNERVLSSPAVADGTVYVGCEDQNLYALDATTGNVERRYETGGEIVASPAVAGDTVFVGGQDGVFHAFDRHANEERWTVELGQKVLESATVAGGHVYVGDTGGRLHALRADTGEEAWSYKTAKGAIRTAPAVVDGSVYVGNDGGYLYALEE